MFGKRWPAAAGALRRLAGQLTKLVEAGPSARMGAQSVIAEPLRNSLDRLKRELDPQRITVDTLYRSMSGQRCGRR
jgi:hypothetical protein